MQVRSPVVLVVDDNAATRKLIRTALSQDGYTVLEAPDGRAAVHAVMEALPDLVLQDLFLPDLDGVDLLQVIRVLPGGAEVPIVAYSGWISRMDEARRQGAGFSGYLLKPVDVIRLRETVRAHLSSSGVSSGDFVGRHALLAMENPEQRTEVRRSLEEGGFLVTAVEDGLQALEAARMTSPDVIIADVLMPRCDGYHLCRAVREDPDLADTPVVLTGTDAVEGDRALAQSVGANAFVVRTPDLREVTDALRMLLGQEPRSSDDQHEASGPARKRTHASPAARMSYRSPETAGEAADVSPAEDAPSEENRPAPSRRPRRKREDLLPSSTDRALARKRRPARRQD